MIDVDRIIESILPDKNGCRIWPRPPRSGPYPTAWIEGKERRLCRYVLARKLGRAIAPGLVARHSCDNPMCVSEDHLSEGTSKQNTQDMIDRNRASWQTGKHVTPVTTGVSHYAAKISEKDVIEIRRLGAARQITQRAIGEMFGLSQQTVSQIIRRQIWTHVNG